MSTNTVTTRNQIIRGSSIFVDSRVPVYFHLVKTRIM